MKHNKKVFIIAEAGVNHNGKIALAKELVDAAVSSQADAIKFQTFSASSLVMPEASASKYQIQNMGVKTSQKKLLKKLELSFEAHREIYAYCRKKNIEFMSSPFDLESVNLLEKIGVRKYKIPSGEITDIPLLKRVARTNKPLIISTGMCTIPEIKIALATIKKVRSFKETITLLHCTSSYPTLPADVNLAAMLTLKRIFNLPAGYSDHTAGYEIAIAAAALGATVIEKHITLSKKMKGPDHLVSLEPPDFSAMVNAIRNVEQAIGNPEKAPVHAEREAMKLARKSIFAKGNIAKGEKFSEENLITMRPATGLSSIYWDKVVGRIATKNYKTGEPISLK
jgi:N,N'-diacetyllegionaminate synthase